MKIVWKLLEKYYQRKGYWPTYGPGWLKGAIEDFRESQSPLKEKMWALRRGFYSYRVKQYGLTEENYKDCLSDRDYKWLYPINNGYRKWIDDKLTMKYILAPFDAYLPRYYFHILRSRACEIIKLMDCPREYPATAEGILALLTEKKCLAVKPSGGTYGIGFCKLEEKDGVLYNNKKEISKEEFVKLIDSLQDHLIMEYVQMHSTIAALNPESLNTIRVMMINERGDAPIIPAAFMRIGTIASGVVDNTAQGGMFCKVDVETGRFYGGEKISKHVITPTETHPDTGAVIEGILPHWELIKNTLLEIGAYMPQLEWWGFDIAITAEGFSIIEINSHQGLHRYPTYPETVKLYFNGKMKAKKGIGK